MAQRRRSDPGMSSERRLPAVRRLVVKIGSAALAESGELDVAAVGRLADQIAAVVAGGASVIVVSSGAVASGFRLLGLKRRPQTIVEKQAAAAVGQQRLMRAWAEAFGRHDLTVAQALLTADDMDHRVRFLNARHTLLELAARRIVPIVNENDSVSFEEIKLGDNDRLSALVATLVRADLLLMLSSIRGLYENGDDQRIVPVVPDPASALAHVRAGTSSVGVGGMATKLEAAAIATGAGIPVILAGAAETDVVARALRGEALGTYFPARTDSLDARKRWLGFSARAKGALVVDDGARRAITDRGASLLPSGVREVVGEFARGAPVDIQDSAGEVFARGLAAYSADECRRIKGRKTTEIAATLGYVYEEEVVHRDDLALLRAAPAGKGAA